MNLYYFANNIYQFSYAIPIYQKIGGTFLVRDKKCLMQFKWAMRRMNKDRKKNGILNYPQVKLISKSERQNLSGIIIFCSNSISLKKYPNAKTIFLEHGTGDKKYGGAKPGKDNPLDYAAKKLLSYDFIFTSGKKNIYRIKNMDIEIEPEKIVKIGGTRFDEVICGELSRQIEEKRLKIKDTSRKNILYAPTWRFGDGTLDKYVHHFIKQITREYNLIIRTHYHDYKRIIQLKLWAKLHGFKHLYFSNPLDQIRNNTFHDFIVSDLMISDISAVIYEYIIMNKPMILISNNTKFRHDMPDEMNAMKYATIWDEKSDIIDLIKQSFADEERTAKYKELLNNCFFYNDGKSASRAIEFLESIE